MDLNLQFPLFNYNKLKWSFYNGDKNLDILNINANVIAKYKYICKLFK